MKRILLLVALTLVSIGGSEHSRAKEGSIERIEPKQECLLPYPQRGRGAGGEGHGHNVVGMQQAPSAFIAEWTLPAAFSHAQLVSAVRERSGAERSTLWHFQAASRGGGGFLPGARVLLDAHNCYPEREQWNDRLDRALKTGLPVAIEQDLAWHTDKTSGRSWSVVVHHLPPSGSEPTLRTYFFEQIRPLVEHALQSGDRKDWPLVTLNLDFKTEEREHLEFIWRLLEEYEDWLCTAPRTATPETLAPLGLRPVLVLTGSSDAQQKVFYDAVRVGGRLRLFGAVNLPNNESTPLDLVPSANNYRRWWNNSWAVVEEGGQQNSGDWTTAEAERLRSLVSTAHAKGLWIRFYTLNGHMETDSLGWTKSYNFGSLERAQLRWQAAVEAGADFIATDQYEALAALRLRNSVK